MAYKSSFLSDKTVSADYSILFSSIPKAVSLNLDPTASALASLTHLMIMVPVSKSGLFPSQNFRLPSGGCDFKKNSIK